MSLAPRLSLLLGTLVLILLAGEGVARIMARLGGPALEESEPSDHQPIRVDFMDLAKPNVRGFYMGVPYRTNSRGIRGPEHTPRPRPGVFRILITGDSVTMGWGIREEQTYARRLQQMLNESSSDHPALDPRHGSRRFEVLNLGVAGVNADFAIRRLRKLSAAYRPHLTIYAFTINDIEGKSYQRIDRKDRKALDHAIWRRALRFKDSPFYLLRELWPRWIMLLEWEVFHPIEAIRVSPQATEWYQNYFENPDAWNDFAAALDLHAQTASERKVCGHVLIHTYLSELTPEHPYKVVYDRVAEAARARGLTVTESLEYFLGRNNRDLFVSAFDIHPNPEGHRILAQALYDGLQALPAECWDERERDAD